MMLLLLAGLATVQASDASPPVMPNAMPNVMLPSLDQAAGPFDPARDAAADLDAALASARTSGKHVLVVFGGGWCHDSLALVDALTAPRAAASMASRYETVWVDVPYSLDARAIPVAQRLGLGDVTGTPTVLILRPDGSPVNLDSAPGWRNAASRKPAAILRALERAAPVPRTR